MQTPTTDHGPLFKVEGSMWNIEGNQRAVP